MFMYVKAAAGIYEMSKALSLISGQSAVKSKSIGEWIRIFTGKTFLEYVDNISEKELLLANKALIENKGGHS